MSGKGPAPRLGQSGYDAGGFGIELHRGEWIARVLCPNDQPIGDNQQAQAAADYWRDRSRAKFECGQAIRQPIENKD